MSNLATSENLYEALPNALKDDAGMRPLGQTAAEALAGLWADVDLPTLYTNIDRLDEDVLDILARDFGVSWYDYDEDITKKRQLIKDCFYVHKHLGTVGAVKRALSDICESCDIQEWFDYSGSAYHFKVSITDPNFSNEKIDKAAWLIDIVKNVRSHLDAFVISRSDELNRLPLYAGMALYSAVTAEFGTATMPDLTGDYLGDENDDYLVDENGIVLGDE